MNKQNTTNNHSSCTKSVMTTATTISSPHTPLSISTTSPILDKFQVQVYNNGKDVKVTPILSSSSISTPKLTTTTTPTNSTSNSMMNANSNSINTKHSNSFNHHHHAL